MTKYNFPKIDLHNHLDGSFRPETMYELAAKYGIKTEVPTVAGDFCCNETQGLGQEVFFLFCLADRAFLLQEIQFGQELPGPVFVDPGDLQKFPLRHPLIVRGGQYLHNLISHLIISRLFYRRTVYTLYVFPPRTLALEALTQGF